MFRHSKYCIINRYFVLAVFARQNRLNPPSLYFGIGNQSMNFLIDVNSAESFVLSNKFKGYQRTFDSSKSKTFLDLKTPLHVEFDNVVNDQSSFAKGIVAQDVIDNFAGIPYKNITFAVINEIEGIPTIVHEKDVHRSGRMGIMPRVPTRKTTMGKEVYGEPNLMFGFFAICQ